VWIHAGHFHQSVFCFFQLILPLESVTKSTSCFKDSAEENLIIRAHSTSKGVKYFKRIILDWTRPGSLISSSLRYSFHSLRISLSVWHLVTNLFLLVMEVGFGWDYELSVLQSSILKVSVKIWIRLLLSGHLIFLLLKLLRLYTTTTSLTSSSRSTFWFTS